MINRKLGNPWLVLIVGTLLAQGCAGTAYIFQPKAAGKKESGAIATSGLIALAYDRSERVLYENIQEDGSAFLHYSVVLKNGNTYAIQAAASDVHIFAEKVPTEVPAGPDGKPLNSSDKTSSTESTDSLRVSQAQAEDASAVAEAKPAAPKAPPKIPTTTVLQPKKFQVVFRKKTLHADPAKKGKKDEETEVTTLSVPADGYVRYPFTARLSKEALQAYAGSAEPLFLVVTVRGSGTLKLPLWVWRTR